MRKFAIRLLRAAPLLAVLSAPVWTVTAAGAAELLMFERAGCPYCLRWDREVAPVYALTPEGKRAPLRRVNLDEGQPKDALAAPVRFTPTFVLMDEGREVGRITGYMNDAMFWGLLGKMVERLDARPAAEGKG